MNSKKVLLYTILFCIGAVSIGVFYGVTHLDKWKMREITKRAEEQRKLLAEQQALSLMILNYSYCHRLNYCHLF